MGSYGDGIKERLLWESKREKEWTKNRAERERKNEEEKLVFFLISKIRMYNSKINYSFVIYILNLHIDRRTKVVTGINEKKKNARMNLGMICSVLVEIWLLFSYLSFYLSRMNCMLEVIIKAVTARCFHHFGCLLVSINSVHHQFLLIFFFFFSFLIRLVFGSVCRILWILNL